MILLLQKIIIVLIAVFAAVLSIFFIFHEDNKFLVNNLARIKRVIFYLLIGSIIISVIRITVSIIYLELYALFLLTLSLVLFNFRADTSAKRTLRVLGILFFVLVAMQFVYPMIN